MPRAFGTVRPDFPQEHVANVFLRLTTNPCGHRAFGHKTIMAIATRRLSGPLLPQYLSASQFREKAAACFRLAVSIADQAVSEQLCRIGSEFEARAAALEAEF
jgi:hypothetical protein